MKKILFPLENNVLGICNPATEEISLEEIIKISIPENTPYKIVDEINVLPQFIKCCDFDQELGYKVNPDRCKDYWLSLFRDVRLPIMEQLDIEFIRAIEDGNKEKQLEISEKKQELRDVTKTPLPSTLEELKNTWPDILGNKIFV
jgi:hypothetical protein